jgi:hypothetical protein
VLRRLTTRCSGRGPINCTARGQLISCGRVTPLALLPVGAPPLNLDVDMTSFLSMIRLCWARRIMEAAKAMGTDAASKHDG